MLRLPAYDDGVAATGDVTQLCEASVQLLLDLVIASLDPITNQLHSSQTTAVCMQRKQTQVERNVNLLSSSPESPDCCYGIWNDCRWLAIRRRTKVIIVIV